VVNRVLEKLPARDSSEWIGCPAIEHNKKKRCFMLPIGEDALLQEVVERFKAAWGEHLDTSALTHLAINRVMPGKAEDELHADVFTGRPGEPRKTMERPSAHNIIYLTGQPSTESQQDQRHAILPDKSKLNDTLPLSVPLSSWPVTKQWKERPDDAAKCGINIVYLTEQPVQVPSNESGQLHFPQAQVTVTPKAGSMVSFAMTEDNDHFVGKFSDQAPVDRISIQLPVSVFGSQKATAYMEYVGNGSPSPPPIVPGKPSYDCTYERGNLTILRRYPGDNGGVHTFNDFTKEQCCTLLKPDLVPDTWFWTPWPGSHGGCNAAIYGEPNSVKWIPDPDGKAYRCMKPKAAPSTVAV